MGKKVSLGALGFSILLLTNFYNISWFLIFAVNSQPRNTTKITQHENFPFYCIPINIISITSNTIYAGNNSGANQTTCIILNMQAYKQILSWISWSIEDIDGNTKSCKSF